MALHVYRFQARASRSATELANRAGASAVVVAGTGGKIVDVQADDTEAADLKDVMAADGYDFLSTDSATAPTADFLPAGAPVDALYVTLAIDGTLTNERVLTPGTGLALADGGAGGNATLSIAAGYGLLSGLTATRIPVASAANALTDYAGLTYTGTKLTIAPTTRSAESNALVQITGPSESAAALTASTNVPDVSIDLARTVQFAAGAKTEQSAVKIDPPTYSSVGATTISDSFTVDITGAPVTGTNVTQTRPWGARIKTRLLVGAAVGGLGLESNTVLHVTGADGLPGGMTFRVHGNAAGDAGTIHLQKARGNTTTPAAIRNADTIGSIRWAGASSSTATRDGARLIAYAAQTWTGSGAHGCYVELQNIPNSTATSLITRMRWHDDGDISIPGDVVIGAAIGTNPGFTADVQGTLGVTGIATLASDLAHTGTKIGFFSTATQTQQSVAALTNNVTSGGTTDQVDTWSDMVLYANDAAAIRNATYQLARKLKQVTDALRLYGVFA